MAIREHPNPGTIVTVDYGRGFVEPEMVKRRLAIILSPNIKNRPGLCTVVPLSLTEPNPRMPYHAQLDVPFELPEPWGNVPRWIKGDMINAVALHRVNLLRMGRTQDGSRIYQFRTLSSDEMRRVRRCVLHGLGLSGLTKHL